MGPAGDLVSQQLSTLGTESYKGLGEGRGGAGHNCWASDLGEPAFTLRCPSPWAYLAVTTPLPTLAVVAKACVLVRVLPM